MGHKREPMMRPEPKPQPFDWQGGPLDKYFRGNQQQQPVLKPVGTPPNKE